MELFFLGMAVGVIVGFIFFACLIANGEAERNMHDVHRGEG